MNTIKRSATWCISGALVFGVAACSEPNPDALIRSAKEHIAKNDAKSAAIQLKSALQQEPNSPQARLLLGSVLLDSGETTSAIVELRKALALKQPAPTVVPILARAMLQKAQFRELTTEFANTQLGDRAAAADLKTSLALAYSRQGKGKEAQAALDSALELVPQFDRARLLQARFKAEARDLDGALALIDEILAKKPDFYEAWQLKGDLLYVGRADAAGALNAHRKALGVRGDLVASHASILSILLSQKDSAAAKRQLDELKKVAPAQLETKYYEADLAILERDFKKARQISQQLLKVASDNPRMLQLAGAIELEAGSMIEAKNYLAKALQIAPNMVATRRLLVQAHLRSGQPDKALEQLTPLLHAAEPDAETLSLAAQAYLLNGDAKSAEAYFSRAAKSNPDDVRSRTALALGAIGKGDVEPGFAQLEAVANADKGIVADLALITARLQRDDFAAALKAIDGFERKQPNTALAANLRGRIQLVQKDMPAARKSFERALEIDPVFYPAIVSLVTMDLAERNPEQARKRFDAVLKADPKDPRALLAVAGLRANAGAGKDDVLQLLAEAVRLNPTEAVPRLLIIDAQMRSKDFKSALRTAQDGVSALPENAELRSALGRVHLAAGNVNQALASFSKAAELQPRSTQTHLQLAELYVKAKNVDAARQSLKRALALSPNLLAAQRNLVVLELSAGRLGEATTLARQLQRLPGGESLGLMLVGDIEAAQKKWDAATATYRAGLKQFNTPEFAVKLHVALQSSHQEAAAEKLAASWLKEHPKDPAMRLHLANTAMAQQRFEAAEANYLAVVALRPDDPIVLNNLAWVTRQLNKPGALAYAQKANALQPNHPAHMDTLAVILGDAGQVNEALEIEKKAVALQPDQPFLRLNLAKLYIKAGQGALAKAELNQLLRLGNKFPAQAEVGQLMKTL